MIIPKVNPIKAPVMAAPLEISKGIPEPYTLLEPPRSPVFAYSNPTVAPDKNPIPAPINPPSQELLKKTFLTSELTMLVLSFVPGAIQ